ncbi:MAG TPA: AIR synthase-related protein [Terriglobia bacterium]|nr:AIR synthase-related protein [Terriglobia bacterium]
MAVPVGRMGLMAGVAGEVSGGLVSSNHSGIDCPDFMPIHAIYTQSQDDAEARNWLAFLRRRGHPALYDLKIERVFWLEGEVRVEKLLPLFINPVHQSAHSKSMFDPASGPILEIAYRPAVTDPETPSILAGARALGERGLAFARLSRRFQFVGIGQAEAQQIAERFLFNKVVERLRDPNEAVHSLIPSGTPDPVATISLKELSKGELLQLSRRLSWYAPLSQLKVIQAHEVERGRPYTDAEVEILVQTWSDHCYHTTWKSLGLLKKLSLATERINHPLVVSSFKDNAGGMKFYEDWVITIKGETHNFPSSIAPFGGVATKHGGVIRDTLGFGKGAYPIGGTTIMGTMDPSTEDSALPSGTLHPELIVSESIRATAYYVNPMGIPMMHALYRRHPGYAKCLALGHSIGLIPAKFAMKDAVRKGDLCVLAGGETGRDGIHGATASSAGMSGETVAKESAAVQIGHPVTERRFATAIPVLRDTGCIRSITDLGAGGISCGAGEMGAETGVVLDLDRVPLKDQTLTAWEILLSESQERMLLAVPPEKLAEVKAILDRYEVGHAVIGEFTDSNRLQASWRGQKVVDLEMTFLWEACPLDPIPVREPLRRAASLEINPPQTPDEWTRAIHGVIGHYHCCDQSPAGARFDTTVQARTAVSAYGGRTHQMPTNLYVSAPLRGRNYGMISTVAFNPLYGAIDPVGMARLMVIEAVTKAVAAGADYREMVLCDNFYTPRARPEVAWNLSRMVEAIADLSVELGIPFISGKDSSSGTYEADGQSIDVPYTLVISAMGRIPDVRRIVTKEFKAAENQVFLVGSVDAEALGGTVYADSCGMAGGPLFFPGESPSIRRRWDALLTMRAGGAYVSASAIAEGGTFLRLFEASFGSGLGVEIDFSAVAKSGEGQSSGKDGTRFDGILFGELTGSVLIEVPRGVPVGSYLHAVPHVQIGEVTANAALTIKNGNQRLWHGPVSDLVEVWSKPFKEMMG